MARIDVGTMNFGKRTPAKEAEAIVSFAFERGLTFFDTANAYNDGEAERILGRAVKGRRALCQIATKVGSWKREGLKRETILAAIDASLERLGTDYVDVYYLHVPDHKTPIEESLEAMRTVLESGKARSFAVSNYASWQILEMIHAGMKPVMSQVLYNVLIREIEIEHLAFARKHDVFVTTYNALAGGLLSGRHTLGPPEKGSRFDGNKLYLNRYWSEAMFHRVEQLKEIAGPMCLVDLAYAWLASRPIGSILVGPASVAHLEAAVNACEKKVPGEEIDQLHLAWSGTDTHYVR
jgi:aryl-alcohol dehydrogenase-like predicted oxidoreductase